MWKDPEGKISFSRERIRFLIKELHYKTAHWLCKTFDAIVLPSFETSQMVSKLHSKTARAMLSCAHYRFKSFLKHKCEEMDVLFIEANEAYTSKTVSLAGEIIENLGGRKTINLQSLELLWIEIITEHVESFYVHW